MNIENNLKKGYFVPVKDKEGDYSIFCPFKDEYGRWRWSGWQSSLDEAEKQLGSCGGLHQNLDELAKKEGWREAVCYPYKEETKIDMSDEELIKELEKRGKLVDGKVLS